MLIVEVKPEESIDRALKRYKKKVKRTRLMQEVRRRQAFSKPSIERRKEIIKASYKEKLQREGVVKEIRGGY
jgi:small subunit ribosomal protein S21